MRSSASGTCSGVICVSWPTFSSRLIRASKSSTRASIEGSIRYPGSERVKVALDFECFVGSLEAVALGQLDLRIGVPHQLGHELAEQRIGDELANRCTQAGRHRRDAQLAPLLVRKVRRIDR